MNAKERRQKAEDEWIKFERDLNRQLEEKGTQYRLIYLPEKDLMPYDDLGVTTQIQDEVDGILDQWREAKGNANPVGVFRVSEEWARTISMALTVYKAVLLNVHGEQLRRELKEAAAKRKQKEDKTDGN